MRLRYECRACGRTVATGELAPPVEPSCPGCAASAAFVAPSGPGGTIERCLACGGPHLFVQKVFPRRLGLAIVVAGAAAFLLLAGMEKIVAGFAVLGGVAALDLLLYQASPLMTVCYHCATEFRGASVNPSHAAFDPKVAFYTAKQVERTASGDSARGADLLDRSGQGEP